MGPELGSDSGIGFLAPEGTLSLLLLQSLGFPRTWKDTMVTRWPRNPRVRAGSLGLGGGEGWGEGKPGLPCGHHVDHL